MCQEYQPPDDYIPSMEHSFLDFHYPSQREFMEQPRTMAPFLACGDLSAWDSDMTYPLQLSQDHVYEYKEPIQKPIDPPYRTAIEMKRHNLFNI